jgi:transposase InsO family protein
MPGETSNTPAGQAPDPTDGGLYGDMGSLAAHQPAPVKIDKVSTIDHAAVCKLPEPLTANNWIVWSGRMRRVLSLADLEEYVDGKIACPKDPIQAKNWKFNDMYAQTLIMNNISELEMIHVGHCKTANLMWTELQAVHESKGHQTLVAILRNLFHTVASDQTDITIHLTKMKTFWENISAIGDDDFKITDTLFKLIISSSLPASWDAFTENYVGGHVQIKDSNKVLSSQQFIGILTAEYKRRIERSQQGETVNQATSYNKPLKGRISAPRLNNVSCKHCGKQGHAFTDCIYVGKSKCNHCNKFHASKECWKCDTCGKYGHLSKNCWSGGKGKGKRKRSGNDDGNSKGSKAAKQESTNIAVVQETVAFNVQDTVAQKTTALVAQDVIMQESNALNVQDVNASIEEGEPETSNKLIDEPTIYDAYDPTDPNDELIEWYDWLADCATTSHVTNQRDAFITYCPEVNTTVSGVGNVKAQVAGRGTVELESSYKGIKYTLRLKDVLHIPTNRNNLLSLGRLDSAGGSYSSLNGVITLTSADHKKVAEGVKVRNNLYKMRVKVRKNSPQALPEIEQTFEVKDETQTWETWHKRYGHVSYSGLRRLYHDNMVDGLKVDLNSPMPDCAACTEAKQFIEPSDKLQKRELEPGDLTHIDLWGKYEIMSINGHQYYIVLVDDAARFITVNFLKRKDEASQMVKNYLMFLKTHGRNPKAIRTDRGKEFINEQLTPWCREHGIEVQTTAPYSPFQNGIAERSNRTLVELARAMIAAKNLPEFLWEPAVKHAAYLRNLSYTKVIPNKTPYEIWNKNKPDVSHLREFGAPVWVLLQGQNETRKILPKSQRRAYVGYEDGSKSVLYYNAETRKILMSRNYRFLTLPENDTPPEQIVVAPDLPREGEMKGGTLPTGIIQNKTLSEKSDSSKRKRLENGDEEMVAPPRKTRGKRVDYKYLNDPFSYEGDEDSWDMEKYATFAVTSVQGDEPKGLKEAMESPEWEEWESAVRSEMEQLHKMGTWILVDKPTDAVPISNRWVFIKKYNKKGDLLKYKGRLVAKGCSQRPGYDYEETYSPVVRLETIRAILALAIIKDYHIAQMDVKGAYLNGTLKEKVYMRQPEGYDDGTDRVCLLIKTLYGLKQAGREWNKELDDKLKQHGFTRSKADPCVYVKHDEKNIVILTVWVDDLLIFASSESFLNKVKDELRSEWDITDLGEPSKIVGIEITRTHNTIKISQEKYIESILKKEGMDGANPISTPMQPSIKLEKNPDGAQGNRSNSYARLLGELQFLANATRPDIAYAVNCLSAYTANPSLAHGSALKKILRYLAGTKSHGITYHKYHPQRVLDGKNLFHGYSDAAFRNADDSKSTSGYVFQMAGGAITWRSKRQSTIALSSTEAEYVALSEAGREACWLRSLFEELGEKQTLPTLIRGDNDGSIAMARSQQFHKRAKHIEMRWHWLRDMVENENIQIDSCRDPEQTADVLTKAISRQRHLRHIAEMGLVPT